jgi:hypothetical protein
MRMTADEARALLGPVCHQADDRRALRGRRAPHRGERQRVGAAQRADHAPDVRRGPVEADVAGLVDAARNRGLGDGYETALLSAYGTVDPVVVSAQLRLHALYGAVWRAHHPR